MPDAKPFVMETEPETKVGDPLLMIGHPWGLPLKYSSQARILAEEPMTFRANLDGFKGSSGSPLLNLSTKQVIGIYTATSLIPDWIYDLPGDCMKLSQMADDFSGDIPSEEITKSPEILEDLDPEIRSAIIGAPSGRSCVLGASEGDSDQLFTRRDLELASVKTVCLGAKVEVLGNEPLSYADGTLDGVRLRIVSNPKHCSSRSLSRATPGEVLWAFKRLLRCR